MYNTTFHKKVLTKILNSKINYQKGESIKPNKIKLKFCHNFFFKGQPILPQLCIGLRTDGYLVDFYCYNTMGLVCQKDMDVPGNYIELSALIIKKRKKNDF